MGTLTLKAVEAGDEATLRHLHAAVRSEELQMESWEPELRDRMLRTQFDAQRRGYRERFPPADEQLILHDHSPVGWLIVDRSGPALRCIDIAIVPEQRNQGIGTHVFRALQEEAAAGDRPLVVTVLRLNLRALALYGRLGFRATEEDGAQAADPYLRMEWRR